MDLPARVQASIIHHQLLNPGAAVLIGVSGGVDSMVLLHILHQLAAWPVTIAHFNHSLRGAESDADEAFVAAVAQSKGLAFISARGDVKAFAEAHGLSIEMAARDLRHQFLIDSATRFQIKKIALAHHADDQVETFWLRILRGDAGPGLAGIRRERPARAGSAIGFIRPLLDFPKSDLLQFARASEIAFREDASNLSPEFLRNRLRLELLARLKTFQPALRDVTLRTAAILGAEKNFLEETARKWLRGKAGSFESLHLALQREIVRLQLVDLALKPNLELIELLRTSPNIAVTVSPAQTLTRSSGGEITATRAADLSFSTDTVTLELGSSGRATLPSFDLNWQIVATRELPAEGLEFFDADMVGPTATLRHWQRGDRFQPSGLGNEAKLQDLFTNLRIPALEKRRRLLAADIHGKIFWVEGLRISEFHKVSPDSKRILRWCWRRRH